MCLGQAAHAQNSPAAPPVTIIKREPVQIRSVERYQVPLSLKPRQIATLSSPINATVQLINTKIGDSARAQSEVLRLQGDRLRLVLNRAKALVAAAELKAQLAKESGNAQNTQVAAVELEVAKAELAIAQYDADQSIVRAPFAGEIYAIHVEPGQFVKAGDPLITVANTSKFVVEIPIDRNDENMKVGNEIELKIEQQTVKGKLIAVLPLAKEFEPMRELVESAASGVVEFENGDNLSAGQTVYAPIVPRHPIIEIPNTALANVPEGDRKVQVIRSSVVRDIPVQMLGPIGDDRTFVSGAFQSTDELITSTTVQLQDGAVIKALGAAAAVKPVATDTQPDAKTRQPINSF